MNRAETRPTIPPEVMAELEAAIDRVVRGVRDPEAAARACEEMDCAREELRQRIGETNIAVELIREARDGE
jgi:hypothetical protein